MKLITLLSLLLFASPLFAASIEDQVRENQQRIRELEQAVQELRNLLDSGNLAAAPEARLSPVGTWQCDNGVFIYKVIFEQGGRMIQQEPTFGKTKELRWSMIGPGEIMLSGSATRKTDFNSQGNILQIDFDSQGNMQVRNPASGSNWDCARN